MKRRIFTVLLVFGLCVGTASAQFGFGQLKVIDAVLLELPTCLAPRSPGVTRSHQGRGVSSAHAQALSPG